MLHADGRAHAALVSSRQRQSNYWVDSTIPDEP
jgi:hypothetical protein